MKINLAIPVTFGGVTYSAGENEGRFDKNDWFFQALMTDGALTITEDDDIEAVVVDSNERDALKAEATALGIAYPNNIQTVKLSQLIADKKALDEASQEAANDVAQPEVTTPTAETVTEVPTVDATIPNPADVAV
jgi:hypothetical protein